MRFVPGGFSCTNSPTCCTWRKVVDGYNRNIFCLTKHHIRISRVFATLMRPIVRNTGCDPVFFYNTCWCDPLFFTTPLILSKSCWLNWSKGREFNLEFRNSVFWFRELLNGSGFRYNTKIGKSVRFYTKRKSGGKTPKIRPSPKQNRSESQSSCIFQELMNRGKYAYIGSWVKYALGKSSCVSKIMPVRSKNRRITVSVFRSTLQLTTFLLKSFRLRLLCYILPPSPVRPNVHSLCSVVPASID